MRNVYAFDFVISVARAIEIATGLKDSADLAKAQQKALDRETDLETAHEQFFRLIGTFVPSLVLDRVKSELQEGRVASVAQMVLAVTCHDGPQQNHIGHWQTCPIHRERLRRIFTCYVECVTGTATKPPADPVDDMVRVLEEELEKLADKPLARWGRLMIYPPNMELVLRTLDAGPPRERLARMAQLVNAVNDLEQTPQPDAFTALVEKLFPPKMSETLH